MTRDEAMEAASVLDYNQSGSVVAGVDEVADLLQEVAAQARREALEEAARLVDGRAEERFAACECGADAAVRSRREWRGYEALGCARAIRRLAEE